MDIKIILYKILVWYTPVSETGFSRGVPYWIFLMNPWESEKNPVLPSVFYHSIIFILPYFEKKAPEYRWRYGWTFLRSFSENVMRETRHFIVNMRGTFYKFGYRTPTENFLVRFIQYLFFLIIMRFSGVFHFWSK